MVLASNDDGGRPGVSHGPSLAMDRFRQRSLYAAVSVENNGAGAHAVLWRGVVPPTPAQCRAQLSNDAATIDKLQLHNA